MTTRPSAVAGLFYADDPDRLRTQVLDVLADVAASTKVVPKALIAPHAGYAYSGELLARRNRRAAMLGDELAALEPRC